MNTNTSLARVLAQAAAAAAKSTTSKAKTPKPCAGGCGNMTRGGNWFPGHDGRVHGRVIQLMRAGCDATEAAGVVDCTDTWDLESAIKAVMADREAAAADQAAEATA